MIDTHCHLYASVFQSDEKQVLERAKAAGIERIFLPAIDNETHEDLIEFAQKYADYCMPMMGLHPCSVNETVENELRIVRDYLTSLSFMAIGEIGLDFYHSTDFKEMQFHAFNQQIEWGVEMSLPLVIHSRSSMDECIKSVEYVGNGKATGIFHCFGGDERQALKVIEMGFYLGIGGVVTYKNAGLAELVKRISLDHIVLETDAPYLTPVPFRGKRNEPSYIQYVAEKIAEIKGISIDEVVEITTQNAKKIFSF